jgi:hypothetical protein
MRREKIHPITMPAKRNASSMSDKDISFWRKRKFNFTVAVFWKVKAATRAIRIRTLINLKVAMMFSLYQYRIIVFYITL